jgi:hypothetical protein
MNNLAGPIITALTEHSWTQSNSPPGLRAEMSYTDLKAAIPDRLWSMENFQEALHWLLECKRIDFRVRADGHDCYWLT